MPELLNRIEKQKQHPHGVLFCLAEKEGLEPSRRLPDLRP